MIGDSVRVALGTDGPTILAWDGHIPARPAGVGSGNRSGMPNLTVEGRSTTSPEAGSRYRRFRPRLVLGYQLDLHALIEELTAMPTVEAGAVLDTAIAALDDRQSALLSFGLTGMDLAPTIRYGATLRVLRDLISQGWTIREDDEGIILDAPGRSAVRLDDPEVAKESIRRSFAFAREAQLREPSTLEFIAMMERRGVDRLFTSGTELATRLTAHGTGAVQPGLQLIEPAMRRPELCFRMSGDTPGTSGRSRIRAHRAATSSISFEMPPGRSDP
jgi:hypothetical protein